MKILSQIYVGDNKFLLSLLGDTKDLSNLPTEYAADASRFLNTDSNAVYVYTSADGWEITEAGQMKDLPVVSATDNGKVLKVANGVWSIGTDESGGSGGGQFVVTFDDVDLDKMTIGLPDKTGAQIYAAIQAGMDVVTYLTTTDGDMETLFKFSLQNYEYSATDFDFMFVCDMPKVQLGINYEHDSKDDEESASLIYVTLAEGDDITGLEESLSPLIVNLTMDTSGETPVLRSDKTYGEIKDAQFAGKHVILKGSLEGKGDFAASIIDAVYNDEEKTVAITYTSGGKLAFTGGLASDYFTVAAE